MDKKKLRNDIILIASLLLVAVTALICVFATRRSNSTVALIYVQNELTETIPLYTKEEKSLTVHGLNGDLEIQTKDGAIAVVKSNCPHQDCVKTGFVNTTNRPIICAYNAVYIVVKNNVK